MPRVIEPPTSIDSNGLRKAIQDEYALLADEPEHGFHSVVGRPLAQLLRVTIRAPKASAAKRWHYAIARSCDIPVEPETPFKESGDVMPAMEH
jgi:hypothetical protein